jgi:hypothetical protein
MHHDRLSTVLRALDSETRLLERAGQKAIALFSILGIFVVFFIVYYRLIPVNLFTATLNSLYFLCALVAIVSLVLTLRPRIKRNNKARAESEESTPACEPAFFVGICEFPSLSAYKQSLEDMVKDEEATLDVYIRQIFNIARINEVKYRHLQHATLFAIIAITIELVIINYLFLSYLGHGTLPPIV